MRRVGPCAEDIYRLKDGRLKGRWKALEARYRRDACRSPGDAFTHLRWLQSLLILGRYEEAFEQGERFLDDKPPFFDMIRFWHPISPAERKSRLETLDRLIHSRRGLPWAFLCRGLVQGGLEGLAVCERAAAYPARRYGWMGAIIGRHYLISGQFEKARLWLERSLSAEPVDWRTHASLAEAYLCLGDEAAALPRLKLALKTAPDPQRGEALAWTGGIRLWMGRYEESLADLREARRLKAPFADCWEAAALLKLGDPEAAIAGLDEAIRVRPMDEEAYVWRGEAKRLLGRPQDALADLSRKPPRLWALFNRVLIWADLGRPRRMESDFNAIPERILAHLRRRLGLATKGALGPRQMARVAAAGLSLSRGFRRDDYDQAVWLRTDCAGAGAVNAP